MFNNYEYKLIIFNKLKAYIIIMDYIHNSIVARNRFVKMATHNKNKDS